MWANGSFFNSSSTIPLLVMYPWGRFVNQSTERTFLITTKWSWYLAFQGKTWPYCKVSYWCIFILLKKLGLLNYTLSISIRCVFYSLGYLCCNPLLSSNFYFSEFKCLFYIFMHAEFIQAKIFLSPFRLVVYPS